jgi:glutathione S-transferase
MIKLHGIALSNYTNMVRTAMVEKNIPYEFVLAPPSQDQAYTSRSPMGKVPLLEVSEGLLTETHAILDYLEDLQPEPALLPSGAFERAKVRELCSALELYIELVGRKGIGVLFGKDTPEHIKKGMMRDLPRGMKAIGQLTKFSPWIAGDQFTYADLFGYYAFMLANTLSEANNKMNLFELLDGSAEWFARVGERDSVKQANTDMAKAREAMGR